MKTLNELAKEIHENAVKHGFYEAESNYISILNAFKCFTKEEKKPLSSAFFAQRIALIHSEVSEALEAHRVGYYSSCVDELIEEFDKLSFETHVKSRVEDELADIIIRVLDLSAHMEIDIEKHIELKMKYNALREYKHGKNY